MDKAEAILAVAKAAEDSASGSCVPNSGWFLRDLAGTADAWSPEVFGFYGFERADGAPPPDEVYRQLRGDEAKRVAKEVHLAAHEQRCFDLQYQIQKRTGEILTLRNRGQIVSVRGNSLVIGIVSDVTRDQSARAQIKEALDLFPSPPCSPITGTILPTTSPLNRSGLSIRQVERVRQLMRNNLGDRLSVEQMAQAVGISCAHFSRTFKIATGETPHRFMLNLRLARARETLLNLPPPGNLSLLAADLGFFDQAHLTKYFRKRYGRTPGQFLRGNRQLIETIRTK